MKHISYIFFLLCVGLAGTIFGMHDQHEPMFIVRATDHTNYCIYACCFANGSRVQAGLWHRQNSNQEICHVIESYAGQWHLRRMKDQQKKDVFNEFEKLHKKRHGLI